MPVAPGDHVVFPASAGVWVDIEEERLLVCRVGQLLGVLDEIDEPRGSDPSTSTSGPAGVD
jgi:chaperonin GroES